MSAEPRAFCTLFDSRYFSRGIAMCESLIRHVPDARIYLFAFDETCREAVRAMGTRQVTVIALEELEDEALRRVRQTRGWLEFLWTCTPATIRHVLERYREDLCTYVDADVYFYSSPLPVLDELAGDDVMITEHRYTAEYDQSTTSGIYNVQFMPFRNTARGRGVLEWWREACLESCELNPAEGKCGDQKYLDDWTTRFPGVHVMQHIGGGVAPWNVQQYRFTTNDGRTVGTEVSSGRGFDLVFYHFHALKLTQRGNVHLTSFAYPLTPDVVELIYRPYVRQLFAVERRIRTLGLNFDPHGALPEAKLGLRHRLSHFKRQLLAPWRALASNNANRVYHASEL